MYHKFNKLVYYELLVKGERIKFRTKKQAITIGKIVYKIDNSIKLIERYTLLSQKIAGKKEIKVIDKREFDRTILIK